MVKEHHVIIVHIKEGWIRNKFKAPTIGPLSTSRNTLCNTMWDSDPGTERAEFGFLKQND